MNYRAAASPGTAPVQPTRVYANKGAAAGDGTSHNHKANSLLRPIAIGIVNWQKRIAPLLTVLHDITQLVPTRS